MFPSGEAAPSAGQEKHNVTEFGKCKRAKDEVGWSLWTDGNPQGSQRRLQGSRLKDGYLLTGSAVPSDSTKFGGVQLLQTRWPFGPLLSCRAFVLFVAMGVRDGSSTYPSACHACHKEQ